MRDAMDGITEMVRRELLNKINSNPKNRDELESNYGQVLDTDQLNKDFDVKGFRAPFVVVKRKSDNKIGSLLFQHNPRYYFSFEPYE